MESISSSNSKSDRIYNFVDSIKKSVSSGSTKVSDMMSSNKTSPDTPSPLMLTEDLKNTSLSLKNIKSPFNTSVSLGTDKNHFLFLVVGVQRIGSSSTSRV